MVSVYILLTIFLLGQQVDEVDDLLVKGRDYLAAQKYEEAVKVFEDVLKLDPINGTAFFNLGLIYGSHLSDENLRDYYWNRYKAASYISVGDAAVDTGDLDEAAVQYKKALEFLPDSGRLRERLAKIRQRIAALPKADSVPKVAGYDSPATCNSLILAHQQKGEIDKAIEVAEKGIALFPYSAPLHNNLATLHALRGDYKKAIAEYQKALEIKPDLAGAYLDMGIIYKEYLGGNDRAVEAFRSYVRLRPEGKKFPEVAELLGPEQSVPKDEKK